MSRKRETQSHRKVVLWICPTFRYIYIYEYYIYIYIYIYIYYSHHFLSDDRVSVKLSQRKVVLLICPTFRYIYIYIYIYIMYVYKSYWLVQPSDIPTLCERIEHHTAKIDYDKDLYIYIHVQTLLRHLKKRNKGKNGTP